MVVCVTTKTGINVDGIQTNNNLEAAKDTLITLSRGGDDRRRLHSISKEMKMKINWKRIWRALRIIFATLASGLKTWRVP